MAQVYIVIQPVAAAVQFAVQPVVAHLRVVIPLAAERVCIII
jgi:hypothetical protein